MIHVIFIFYGERYEYIAKDTSAAWRLYSLIKENLRGTRYVNKYDCSVRFYSGSKVLNPLKGAHMPVDNEGDADPVTADKLGMEIIEYDPQ